MTSSSAPGSAHVRLKLRDDLRCSLHEFGGQACYVVEDPARSRFFRVGLREWTFLSFLDGHNTPADALELAGELLGSQRLTQDEAVRLCQWLVESQLVAAESSPTVRRRGRESSRHTSRASGAKVSPLFIQLPLCNPDHFLTALEPWCRWAFTFQGFLLWISLCLAGLHQAVSQGRQFLADAAELASPQHWPALVAVWIGLKIVHELAHAVACKHYGGSVPCAGVALRVFYPVAYVDLTSAWRFRSKWQRAGTSAAGIVVELALAALAAVVWSNTRDGVLHGLAHKTALMAGISTLAFNLNPLMRFDGYYILCDLLGLPNLAARGRAYVRYLGRRWVLGARVAPPREAGWQGRFVRLYGVAAALWGVAVMATIVVVAASYFHGLGLILSAAALAAWLGVPLARALAALRQPRAWAGIRPGRTLLRLGIWAGTLAGVLCLPSFGGNTAPAVVEYAPLAHVRATTAGTVRKVCVADGEAVQAGQLLAVLDNEELRLEAGDLALQIEQSLLRARVAYQDGEIARMQVEQKNREALEARLAELRQRLARLELRAPLAGRVVAANLETLVGCYLDEGDELMTIGDERSKELVVSLEQDQWERQRGQAERTLSVRVAGRGRIDLAGDALECEPRASCTMPHPALGAQAGGPLAVRMRPDPGHEGGEAAAHYEFSVPRLVARVQLPPAQSLALHAGEVAVVRLPGPDARLGTRLASWLAEWFERTLSRGAQRR